MKLARLSRKGVVHGLCRLPTPSKVIDSYCGGLYLPACFIEKGSAEDVTCKKCLKKMRKK